MSDVDMYGRLVKMVLGKLVLRYGRGLFEDAYLLDWKASR